MLADFENSFVFEFRKEFEIKLLSFSRHTTLWNLKK